MAILSMKMQCDSGSTSLPNAFIDLYLPKAYPAYSVLYIYCYRKCLTPSPDLSTSTIAKELDLLESDVLRGLRYWEKEGLISLIQEDDSFDIIFLPVGGEAIKDVVKYESEKIEPEKAKTSVQMGVIRPFKLETCPQYSVQELELYQSNSEEICRLFAAGEKSLGRLLNYHELSTLFGFYDWLRLPVEVIEALLAYCAENGHRNMRYMEKAALDWAERGIDSQEKAQGYITTYNKDYREIMKAVGQSTRNPSKKETEYMDKWLNELGLSMELILEACDKTIMQVGKPQFSYTDKILSSWHKQGISTITEVEDAEKKFYSNKDSKEKSPAGKSKKTGKNKFADYRQREWDYEKLEKLEMEYLEKKSERIE